MASDIWDLKAAFKPGSGLFGWSHSPAAIVTGRIDMDRRTFLRGMSALAAGVMVPTLRLRPGYDLHHMVGQWVGDHYDSVRYQLDLPFVVEGQAYGTDSRAIARIHTSEDDTNLDAKRRLPDVIGTFDSLWHEHGGWHRLPIINRVEHPDKCSSCPKCSSDGSLITCPKCDGEGICCDHCNNIGTLSNGACPVCRGVPYGNYRSLQVYGDKLIAAKFDDRLRAIPGVLWCSGGHGKSNPILYRSDIGIEGMIMPVVP